MTGMRKAQETQLFKPVLSILSGNIKDWNIKDFASVVTEIADKEMEFWRREAPALPENWYNEPKFEARFAWHNRLNLTDRLVRALAAINTPETRRKIAEIRDFCESQPRLMEKNGPDFLYGLCLAKLGEVPVRR
jgi:hypothetical protein